MAYQLTYDQLLSDLHQAYLDARRRKRNKPYQLHFEANAEENLAELCHELWTRTYRPEPATCFIVTSPKQREVFAAQFRDRIVHHLYYNYTHEMLERTFIADSYSCIKKRGTHYGISRLERHIHRVSLNYTRPCYVLKMDIQGYFMHINRQRLLTITLRQLRRMARHRVHAGCGMWNECVDFDFVEYLTHTIVLQDPAKDCRRRGTVLDWYGLPDKKSLFKTHPGCGLPIGNLTSQLFSNVYLNEFDQYMKRCLRCRHYGRYVDDFYVVSADRRWLCRLQEPVSFFLFSELDLAINRSKTMVADVCCGVEFLGAYLKPRRRYVSNRCVHHMERKIPRLRQLESGEQLRSSLNSFLGILLHYQSYRLRLRLFYGIPAVYRYGYYKCGMRKFVLFRNLSISGGSYAFARCG